MELELPEVGSVLVHCFAGRSRSTTIVAAYAMATEGTTLKDTMARIHDARPCAAPNEGFMRQLRLFEVELGEARKEGRLLGRIQVDAARCRDACSITCCKSSMRVCTSESSDVRAPNCAG